MKFSDTTQHVKYFCKSEIEQNDMAEIIWPIIMIEFQLEFCNTYYAMRTCIQHAEHFLILTRVRVYQNHIEDDLILLCKSPRGGAIPSRLFLGNYRTDHPEILLPYNSELTMVVCNVQCRYVRSPLDISHISPEGFLQWISQNVCHQSLLKLCRILVWAPWSDIWEGLYVNVQKVSEY